MRAPRARCSAGFISRSRARIGRIQRKRGIAWGLRFLTKSPPTRTTGDSATSVTPSGGMAIPTTARALPRTPPTTSITARAAGTSSCRRTPPNTSDGTAACRLEKEPDVLIRPRPASRAGPLGNGPRSGRSGGNARRPATATRAAPAHPRRGEAVGAYSARATPTGQDRPVPPTPQ
jgi:hypothetical protein